MQVSIGAGPVRFYGPGALLWWLAARAVWLLVRLLMVAVCRPRTTCAVLGVCGLWWALVAHPVLTHVTLFVVVEVAYWWHLIGPTSFRRTRLPAVWRSLWLYRRLWRVAMQVAELTRTDADGRQQLPRLGRVRCTATADLIRVRGLLGQRFTDWQEAGPMLAHVFGATGVEVHRGDNRRLTLELARGTVGRSWDRDRLTTGTDR